LLRRVPTLLRTLNEAFRKWVSRLAASEVDARFDVVMGLLRHTDAGGHFTRDELNQR